MKPHYFMLTCCILLLSKNAVGQGSEVELQFIPSVTNLRGNSSTEEISDPTFHISAGLGYNYLFRNYFLLKTTVIYDNKGADGSIAYDLKDENNNTTGTQHIEFRNDYQYITVPVQFGRR